MRIFELTAHVQAMGRGQGRSVTAAAAYRACCVIDCEREGRTHDYSRKDGLEASGIVVPAGAPAWASVRGALWNAAELRERNGKRGKRAGEFKMDARPAREVLFSFPVELSEAGRLEAARIIARHLTDAHGVAADFAIHRPGKEGDQRNYHCHMMWTARRMTADGLGEKAREWDDYKTGPGLVKSLRAFIADTLNAGLESEGQAGAVHVEHRSFAERGETDSATKHEGPGKTNARRNNQAKARRDWQQTARPKQEIRHREERAALKAKQDAALSARMAHLDDQERLGIERIKAELARDHAADRPATGMRRAFDRVTGQAMRDDQARQQRAADRDRLAAGTIEAFKRGMQEARAEFVRGQQQDRKVMADRHAAEDRQFGNATDARVTADRVAEVQARRERVERRQRNHDRDRSRGL